MPSVEYLNKVQSSPGPMYYQDRHSYHANVLNYLERGCPGTSSTERLFGIELELVALRSFHEVTGYLARLFNDHPIFICKRDSSLPSAGFEIVTAPLTKSEAIGFMTDAAPRLRYFAESETTTGLHIHTTRPSSRAVDELGQIVSRHDNTAWLDNIAGRPQNHWCFRQVSSRDHSVALNMSHHGTLEFRLFASTLHRTRLRGAIEWVDAMCEYATEIAAIGDRPLTAHFYEAIELWISLNQDKYPNLVKVMQNRYPTRLRALHISEGCPADEIEEPPYPVDFEPGVCPVSVIQHDTETQRQSYERPRSMPRPEMPRRRRPMPRHPSSQRWVTPEGNLNLEILREVITSSTAGRSLGTTRSGVPGPSNCDVALWIASNSRVDGLAAAFPRARYHNWYYERCEGQLTSRRGVVRIGQALYDHATYHANQVLTALGFNRNVQPWRDRYAFTVPTEYVHVPPSPQVWPATNSTYSVSAY